MSNFQQIIELFTIERDTLTKEIKIFEAEGYDTVGMQERISNLSSFLAYAELNNNNKVVSLIQMNAAIGFPVTIEQAQLKRDAQRERDINNPFHR